MEQLKKDNRCCCGKLLFKGEVLLGKVEIKCKRCHAFSLFSGE